MSEELRKRLVELNQEAYKAGADEIEGGGLMRYLIPNLVAAAMEACRWNGHPIDKRHESSQYNSVEAFFTKMLLISKGDGFNMALPMEEYDELFNARAADMIAFVTPHVMQGVPKQPAEGPPFGLP